MSDAERAVGQMTQRRNLALLPNECLSAVDERHPHPARDLTSIVDVERVTVRRTELRIQIGNHTVLPEERPKSRIAHHAVAPHADDLARRVNRPRLAERPGYSPL